VTGMKQRTRSVRRKNTKAATSDPTIVTDLLVEDTEQDSVQPLQGSARKLPRRRAEIAASDLPSAAVGFTHLTLLLQKKYCHFYFLQHIS